MVILAVACTAKPGHEPVAPATASASVPADRPNVLVYLVDTLRRDHLGVYGCPRPTSPSLDRLAADAVVFDQAYAPSSWTRTSTASLLTGLDPLHHGARSRRHRLPPQVTMLSERLAQLGYRTEAVVTNPHVVEYWGFAQGFADFRDLGARSAAWRDVPSDEVNDEVFPMLPEGPAAEPFFLYVHTIDPHAPNNPPPPYDRLFTDQPRAPVPVGSLTPATDPGDLANLEALYDSEIRFNDEHFGQLLAELQRRNLYRDTLIVFASDHGEEFLDHGRGGHGQQLFNEVVRVPLIVKLPANAHAGTRVAAPVSLIDVVPTILAALGATASDSDMDGVDLLPLLAGGARQERPLLLDLDLVRHDGVLFVASGIIANGYKYIEEEAPRRARLLYDLAADPLEQHDLLAAKPDVAAGLAAELGRLRAGHEAGIHFQLAARAGDRPTTVEGRITTAGRFVNVRPRHLESGDRLALDETAHGLSFRIELEDYSAHRAADRAAMIQDVDSWVLEVDPPAAAVVVERLEATGSRALPVFLGPARRPSLPPLTLEPADPELAISSLDILFRDEVAAGRRIPEGLFVAVVPAAEEADEASLPENLQSRLKALGYLN